MTRNILTKSKMNNSDSFKARLLYIQRDSIKRTSLQDTTDITNGLGFSDSRHNTIFNQTSAIWSPIE
jgi:hypothetical protein